MSNQPKITYRSDTTGCTYQMMQHSESFTVQTVNFDGLIEDESGSYNYIFPWRRTVDKFFDVVTGHINTRRWMP